MLKISLYEHRITVKVILCLLLYVCVTPSFSQERVARGTADDGRVHLVHTDKLSFDQYKNPEAQILNGNVAFYHQGAELYCDSAHFYEKSNSFEAFGDVRMFQGDTLSLFSDYAFYDGNEQMAQVRYDVVLKHRETTLYTDSLNYDRILNVGYFFDGGRLVDNTAELTSDWGEYNTSTKIAIFNYDVRLKDNQSVLLSDTLHYNTALSEAHVVGPSNLTSGSSHIYSEDGYYNTKTEKARLYSRSVVRDGAKVIVADTLLHDVKAGTSEGFVNVEYNDTVNQNIFKCDYFWYDDSIGYAMATRKALAIDYSQGDSLFMHADTFKIFTYNIKTDSVYRIVHAYNKVRAYRTDVQAVCDSLEFNSLDSCMTMYFDPVIWNGPQQVLGEVVRVYLNDSTVEWAHVENQALIVERVDTNQFNQISGREVKAYFVGGNIERTDVEGNVKVVYYYTEEGDSVAFGMNTTECTYLTAYMKDRQVDKLYIKEQSNGVFYPILQVPTGKDRLSNFAWLNKLRPLSKEDILIWRGKDEEQKLKVTKRREVPLPSLKGKIK